MDITRIEEGSEAWLEIQRGIEAGRDISLAHDGDRYAVKVKIGEGMWTPLLSVVRKIEGTIIHRL